MPIIDIKETKPKFCTMCLICEKWIDEYDYPPPSTPKVCDECKRAVEWIKKQMPKENK